MKLKKAIVFILCAVMVFCLTACEPGGGGGDDPEIDTSVKYTVTFNMGDADGQVNAPEAKKAYKNATVALPVVTWEGHVFAGWFEGSKQYYDTTPITHDVTLVAHWSSQEEVNEQAKQYEDGIASWSQAGHLYIHYKRYDHNSSEETKAGTPTNTGAPNYNNAVNSQAYADRGLWLWPKNEEGRLFNAAWIDVSGAVYDILIDHEYTDAAWDPDTKTNKGQHINYKTAVEIDSIGMQLFSIKSRKEAGFWANDGGNNYLTLSEIKREDGSYHWFVSQGRVGSGSAKFAAKEVKDPYEGDDGTKHASKGNINSNRDNKSTYPLAAKAAGYDDVGVGYQIFIASFRDGIQDDKNTPKGKGMGDLRGIIDALDEGYFTDLNVDVLWLTPFQESTNYHGYDIKDYFSVDPRFGTLADYRELVYKAHKKNIKVVMDFVLNHTAQSNPWFVKSQNLEKDGDIDYRNFYNWITEAQYNTLSAAQKKQWYKDDYGYYFYSSFSSDMPELNYDYQPVRDAIIDVCNYWMAFGLDGFRLDAVKHIYMYNETKFVTNGGASSDIRVENGKSKETDPYAYDMTRNLNFWREFNYRLKANYPNAFIVSENLDGNPYNVGPFYQGMDSQFNFHGYYESGHAFAACGSKEGANGASDYKNWIGGALGSYKKELQGEVYNNEFGHFDVKGYTTYNSHYIDGRFTSNHDLPRARDLMNITTTGSNEGWRSFFNSAAMDSLPNPTGVKTDRVTLTDTLLRMYYAFNMTTPGVSWIYYGDELGMTGNMNTRLTGQKETPHEDRIYRQPMKWHDTVVDNASFAIGYETYKCELVGLNATSYVKGYDVQKNDSKSIYRWMKLLTKVRNDHPELINGSIDWSSAKSEGGVLDYIVRGTTGSTHVIITTQGSINTSGKTVYASFSSGSYGVAIFKA